MKNWYGSNIHSVNRGGLHKNVQKVFSPPLNSHGVKRRTRTTLGGWEGGRGRHPPGHPWAPPSLAGKRWMWPDAGWPSTLSTLPFPQLCPRQPCLGVPQDQTSPVSSLPVLHGCFHRRSSGEPENLKHSDPAQLRSMHRKHLGLSFDSGLPCQTAMLAASSGIKSLPRKEHLNGFTAYSQHRMLIIYIDAC